MSRFAIKTAAGSLVKGFIYGCNGCITGPAALSRVRSYISAASAGLALPINEPTPGHCEMMVAFDGTQFDAVAVVDLRGATVERA